MWPFENEEERKERLEKERAEVDKYTEGVAKMRQERELEKQYDEILSRVIFTPETIDEYQKRAGCVIEVIDTSEREKMIVFEVECEYDNMYDTSAHQFVFAGSDKLKKRLAEGGIEAILRANYITHSYDRKWDRLYISGLPVAKKKGGPYR